MDLKSKLLIGFLVVVIFLSIAATFYKYMVLQDFDVTQSVPIEEQ